MQKNKVLKQALIKYNEMLMFAVVGIINTGIDFGVFSFMRYAASEMSVVYAQNTGYIVGLLSSFLLNKYLTFRNNANSLNQVILFLLCNGMSLYIGMSSIYLLHNELGLQEHIAKLFFVTPLTAIINFIGYKFVVFRKAG